MEINLVEEGLKFMVLGMVTVFLFLILLVIVLNFQAKIINKFFPQKVVLPTKRTASSPQQPASKNNKALIAAITAAITTFKNLKN
jgi:oxaloacetate decarboxylase gamma subunit